MAVTIGFDNSQNSKHKLTNALDGNLVLSLYVSEAKGDTVVYLNGTENNRLQAGEGTAPFYCGNISLPRGEFILEIQSACAVRQILVGEDLQVKDSADFHLQYANRQGQDVFAHEMPQYTPEMLELLQRHGFFYQNPRDCAGGHMPSGDRSAAWAAANRKSVCRGTWSDRSGRQTGYHGRIHAVSIGLSGRTGILLRQHSGRMAYRTGHGTGDYAAGNFQSF